MRWQRTPLSSHVMEIGYDEDQSVLAVRYAPDLKNPGGRLVEYVDVEQDTADEVMTSPSVGAALHMLVRGKYQHRG